MKVTSYRCDRCGDVIEGHPSRARWRGKWVYISAPGEGEEYHLCKSCNHELAEWLDGARR